MVRCLAALTFHNAALLNHLAVFSFDFFICFSRSLLPEYTSVPGMSDIALGIGPYEEEREGVGFALALLSWGSGLYAFYMGSGHT